MDCFTLREHQQKTVNLLRKGKLVMKIFFQILLNKGLMNKVHNVGTSANELIDDFYISNQLMGFSMENEYKN